MTVAHTQAEFALPVLDFEAARKRLSPVVSHTPLMYNQNLSRRYQANIFLKREDLQVVRSYKIRGAFNMMSALPQATLQRGVVCASAGNHAQGFAYSCAHLQVKGVVFMPSPTPKQKIHQVSMFGDRWIDIQLIGDTFDDCQSAALAFAETHHMTFIPPFEHPQIIEGQGTVGLEILEDLPDVDFIFIPVGGGGLASGVGLAVKPHRPQVKLIGAEPEGAPSMLEAFRAGYPVKLHHIDNFVDGAAVRQVGELTFQICRRMLDDMILVPEGRICSTILRLYNEEAMVVEPAGALAISALPDFREIIKGKNVVCIVSGSNNDIDRMQEIKERSLLYEGLKHYFIIRFAQRPGALREFVNEVLGPNDDIVRFEYMQKHHKETGPALVGIELKDPRDYELLIERMRKRHIQFTELNKDDTLFGFIV
ncbi:MAG: threonine ammonia-lyase IlvA [Thermoflavifilum sp.]|nr:threonine ammonia-lyase IlvA [Thermoflavifilum sp.]